LIVNVPVHVENAARDGIVLIVSKCELTGRTIRWRSKLTDHGWLLTQENGLRYLMPIIEDPTHPERNRAQMLSEDLLPYLTFLLAKVRLSVDRGDPWRAAFFATRLASVIGENPEMMAGWYDEQKVKGAMVVIELREHFEAVEAVKEARKAPEATA
jgi:hypothetical protein